MGTTEVRDSQPAALRVVLFVPSFRACWKYVGNKARETLGRRRPTRQAGPRVPSPGDAARWLALARAGRQTNLNLRTKGFSYSNFIYAHVLYMHRASPRSVYVHAPPDYLQDFRRLRAPALCSSPHTRHTRVAPAAVFRRPPHAIFVQPVEYIHSMPVVAACQIFVISSSSSP